MHPRLQPVLQLQLHGGGGFHCATFTAKAGQTMILMVEPRQGTDFLGTLVLWAKVTDEDVVRITEREAEAASTAGRRRVFSATLPGAEDNRYLIEFQAPDGTVYDYAIVKD